MTNERVSDGELAERIEAIESLAGSGWLPESMARMRAICKELQERRAVEPREDLRRPRREHYVEGDYGDGAYRRDLAEYEASLARNAPNRPAEGA